MQRNKLAVYLRLSKEEDGEGESLSITNQRSVIEDYLHRAPELGRMERAEYIDENISGCHIKRPALSKLLEDINKKEIGCIIVKDFSRFMRNHIIQGNFLEIIFPLRGVRFISVNDNYDSQEKSNELIPPVLGMISEFYARDMSGKMKAIKRNQAKIGAVKPGAAPYGYSIERDNKNMYTIDNEAADVVKRIFSLALKGYECIRIARLLNDDKVPSPGAYKRLKGENRAAAAETLWSSQAVRNILRNEAYIGSCILGKRKNTGFGVKIRKSVPRSEWYSFHDRHEAIITIEDFAKVQEIRSWRPMSSRNTATDRPISVPIVCGVCGHALRRQKRNGNAFYFCGTPGLISECGCMKGRVNEKELVTAFLCTMQAYVMLVKSCGGGIRRKKLKTAKGGASCKSNTAPEISGVYKQYKAGKISREEFIRQKEACESGSVCGHIAGGSDEAEGEAADGLLSSLHIGYNPDALDNGIRFDNITVDKILVYTEKHIRLLLKYAPVS